jgi:hypothetical protein
MRRYAIVLCLALAAACGGNSTAPTPIAVVSASPSGVVLVSATRVTFTGSTTDGLQGALTYSWSFGDGVGATGQTVTHVFSEEGTFTARLTVTDTRGGSAIGAVVVQARGLSGHWTPLQNGVPGVDAIIAQSGPAVAGQYTNECCTHTFEGEVADPRAITLVFHFSGCPRESRTFVGTVAADLNTITLAGPNCNVPNTTVEFTRK